MKSLEMVRCLVSSPMDKERGNTQSSLRYVPGEIFRLWQYLMVQVKGFEIAEKITGVWLDEEQYSRDRNGFSGQSDRVVEVSFIYTRDTTVGRPVIRYFPSESLDDIMGVFLKHFSKEHIHGHTRKQIGYFVPGHS